MICPVVLLTACPQPRDLTGNAVHPFHQAIVGMSLFGQVMLNQNLDRHANFETFPATMLMLGRWVAGKLLLLGKSVAGKLQGTLTRVNHLCLEAVAERPILTTGATGLSRCRNVITSGLTDSSYERTGTT